MCFGASSDRLTMDDNFTIVLDLATDTSPCITEALLVILQNRLNGDDKRPVITLSRTEDVVSSASSTTIVSESCLDLLFKAKTRMDDLKVTDFVLITSLLFKKYWETVCVHMFSPVHNWSVAGMDVPNQAVDIVSPDLGQVEASFKEYLKTVGRPDQVRVLRSAAIPEAMFNAGFHERHGGVSHLSSLASLNMLYTIRKPDPISVIEENRRRLAQAAGFELETLNVAKVEHDKVIWVVGSPQPPKFDGVATNIPGVTVAAPGADCSMILLADTKTGACGAVHAGWRGTTLGAVRALLATMIEEFGTDPKDVKAAVGPTIHGKCFDLPACDATPVHDLDPSFIWPSSSQQDWVHADLVKANVKMLEMDGVPASNIDTSNALCTVCNQQFFSHRRDGIPFGNQIGFISCKIPN
ncbi:unnamed protein product [Lymnaea stagnalis]|uniref:Uncharacterized protein n=1 Tax=Lymnaea stagnalis TaxID=6523 RepID=A0AAV2HN87_LYMST